MSSKGKFLKQLIRSGAFIKSLPTIGRMVKAIFKGKYKPNWSQFIWPVLAFVYLIFPLDFIPDIIPILGWADDLALLALALPSLMKEVERFRLWEKGSVSKDLKTIDADFVEIPKNK